MSAAIEADPYAELDIPDALQESLANHRANLARLVVSLRSAGLSEAQIEMSVSVTVESYKQELMRAIKSMMR